MITRLAGFNIDKELIDKFNLTEQATPETLSAAYARISRSNKSVTELRHEAIHKVAKARRSNETIIFDMGHSSIAEHAVFNFDIIGISRYLTEFVQKSRLASFTEKSQRYVTWNSAFVTPPELENSPLKKDFQETLHDLFALYKKLLTQAEDYYQEAEPHLSKKNREEMAKEDARYVLPLATGTQMGMTLNARSLENLLRRLANLDLEEAKSLYSSLITQVKEIAPSLIRYVEPDPYTKKLQRLGEEFSGQMKVQTGSFPLQTTVDIMQKDPEERILTGLIFRDSPQDFDNLVTQLKKIRPEKKKDLFRKIFSGMKPYHQVPKAFELVDCSIQTSISSSCFAQLKRHRIASLIHSGYQPLYGFVIPEIFLKTGSEQYIRETLSSLATLFDKLEQIKKGLGSYLMTNAHRTNLILKANLREMYHFSRLRSDIHAQWEIRQLSQEIDQKLKQIMPDAAGLLMGKDSFSER